MAKVAGSLWIEGNDFHYIDAYNREWYMRGIMQKAVSGARPGSIWIDPVDHYLKYINEAGTGVFYPAPYGDAVFPLNATPGSLWVSSQDNQVHWATLLDPNWNHNVRAHVDAATASSHSDSHVDQGHVDIIHTDAHTDQHGDTIHQDYHTDIGHYDFNDQAHADFNDEGGNVNHQDLTEHQDYYPSVSHGDGINYTLHIDYLTQLQHQDYSINHTDSKGPAASQLAYHYDYVGHGDTPHGDSPHQDGHTDSPHQDQGHMDYHEDATIPGTHQDVPHQDTPHVDAPHGDAHTDAHTDTPHGDEPIYIGP